MDLIDKLKRKKIQVTEIPKWGPYLRKEWEDSFANHLTKKEKASIHLFAKGGASGHLWHVFSYNTLECLEGEKAEEAFNYEAKKDCYVFFQHEDDALLVENALLFHTDDLFDEEDTDMYIVDKQFQWTFAVTHETGLCGPYFTRIKES
ncbi:DUF4275 family protein [Rossellomorea vietnamensis]|uniref:DUF4275 family protein n=1 Tax=Rossellomorea vietnamensis TaxID=218284 RepID=UPI003CF7921C